MVAIYYGKNFLKSAKNLPQPQQEKLAKLLEKLAKNPYERTLHTKHLTGKLSGLYSFRITRDYRVVFQFLSPNEIRLVEVAHRKDIYK